jgi:very-short-patch-repair endonuclease
VVVCPKVRLADVITCQPRDWEDYGRPISGKHVDFVLADAATMTILLIVELDDRTHCQPDRRERDRLVDAALASAGVPVLHVTEAAGYDRREISSRVAMALEGKG